MEEIHLRFDSNQKRFIAKYIIVFTILKKYHSNLYQQKIIPDFNINKTDVIEVMHQDLKNKRAFLYKIYCQEKETFIEKYEVSFFDETQMVKVNTNTLSEDLEELNKQISNIVR